MRKLERKQYLERRLVEGLRVIHGLFEGMANERDFSIDDYSRRIQDVDLTSNQRDFYQNVRSRANKARQIVRYLEGRFGLTHQKGNYERQDLADIFSMKFDDPEGLHFLIMGKKAPQGIQAYSHNLGISFLKRRWSYRDGLMAHISERGVDYDQLATPSENTIERLERNKTTNLAEISMMLPSLDICIRRIKEGKWFAPMTFEDKVLSQIFGQNYMDIALGERALKGIYHHEIRHIFDNIIGDKNGEHTEAQTHLYEGDPVAVGANRDFNVYYEGVEKAKANLQMQIDFSRPEIFIENARRWLEKSEGKGRFIEEKILPLWRLNIKKIDSLLLESKKVLSYLFSQLKA